MGGGGPGKNIILAILMIKKIFKNLLCFLGSSRKNNCSYLSFSYLFNTYCYLPCARLRFGLGRDAGFSPFRIFRLESGFVAPVCQ